MKIEKHGTGVSYKSKSMNEHDFIRTYALLIFNQYALKVGLLIACGDSIKDAFKMVCGNSQRMKQNALAALVQIGYLEKADG